MPAGTNEFPIIFSGGVYVGEKSSRLMNLAETELVVEAKLSQKQMDSLEALLDNEGVSDVNIVSYNGSTLL